MKQEQLIKRMLVCPEGFTINIMSDDGVSRFALDLKTSGLHQFPASTGCGSPHCQ